MKTFFNISRDIKKGPKQVADVQCNVLLHFYTSLWYVTQQQSGWSGESDQDYLNSCTTLTNDCYMMADFEAMVAL